MLYQALFFDWDGTLVEHSKLIAEGHNHVRKHFGQESYDAKAAINRGHQSTRELYPILYGDRADEAETLFYDFFMEHHISDINPFEDSERLLKTAHALGITMGVVSNKKQVFLDREIDHIGWRKYFVTSIGAGTAEKDKPSSSPLALAMTQVDPTLNKDNVLYIGDTETDLLCAADMGCAAFLTTRGRNMNDLIETYAPALSHDSYAEFIELLENTNQNQLQKNT